MSDLRELLTEGVEPLDRFSVGGAVIAYCSYVAKRSIYGKIPSGNSN
jgi:hypothetical protein